MKYFLLVGIIICLQINKKFLTKQVPNCDNPSVFWPLADNAKNVNKYLLIM